MGKGARKKTRSVRDDLTPSPLRRRQPALLVLTVALLAVVVYAGSLHHPFVYDDHSTVVENPTIQNGNLKAIVLFSVFRPLANLSYAADYALGGLHPLMFHLTNLILHVLNVGLLFVLGRRLAGDAERGGSGGAADLVGFVAATLLAIHPLMTEAVGYASGRAEVLCGTFTLVAFGSLRAYLAGARLRSLVVGLAAFVLALATKETAALLPLVLLAWDLLFLGGEGRRRRLRLHLPLIGVVALAGLARVAVFLLVEQTQGVENPWDNLLVEATVVWRYVGLLLVPWGQSLVHDVRRIQSLADPAALAALTGLAGAAWGLWRLRRRFPLVSFGMVWFALLLVPSHVVPLSEAMAEHRLYLAGMGFFLAVAAVLVWLFQRVGARWLPVVVLAPIIVVLAVLTVARLRVWSDPVRLWSDAAHKAPRAWAAQYALADVLRTAGRCEEALPFYRRATTLVPDEVDAHLNLGICLAQLGRPREARDAFLEASRIAPDNPKPHNNLGLLAMASGRPVEARSHLEETLRLDPKNVRAREILAEVFEVALGDRDRAAALCEEIRAIAPGTPGVEECIQRNRRAPTPQP